MLKIIDDFDLKGLEEFGFIDKKEYYEYFISMGLKIPNNNKSLVIYKDSKQIALITFTDKEMVETVINPVIYDLIQAGIVEKV